MKSNQKMMMTYYMKMTKRIKKITQKIKTTSFVNDPEF